jgi:hypothetical protein
LFETDLEKLVKTKVNIVWSSGEAVQYKTAEKWKPRKKPKKEPIKPVELFKQLDAWIVK